MHHLEERIIQFGLHPPSNYCPSYSLESAKIVQQMSLLSTPTHTNRPSILNKSQLLWVFVFIDHADTNDKLSQAVRNISQSTFFAAVILTRNLIFIRSISPNDVL